MRDKERQPDDDSLDPGKDFTLLIRPSQIRHTLTSRVLRDPGDRGKILERHAGAGGPAGHFILEDIDNPYGPTSLVELVLPPHINAALGAAGAPPSFAGQQKPAADRRDSGVAQQ